MAVPTWVSVGTLAGGTGDVQATPGAGVQSGDILLYLVESSNEAAATPAGWTQPSSSPQGAGPAGDITATRLTLFVRRHPASGFTSPTITDTGQHALALIGAVRDGGGPSDPIDLTATAGAAVTATISAGAAVAIPAVDAAAESLVIDMLTWNIESTPPRVTSWVNGSLANLTERFDAGSAAGDGGGIAINTGEKATAGSTGVTTATIAEATHTLGLIKLAIKPFAGGPATRTAADTLGTTETAARAAAARARSASDTLGTADAATRGALTRSRSAADALGTTDSAARAALQARSADDALGTTETAARDAQAAERSAVDALGTSDEALLGGAITSSASDTLGTTEVATRDAAASSRTATDTLGTSDDARTQVQFIDRTATDELGTTDDATRQIAWTRSAADMLGTTEVAGGSVQSTSILFSRQGGVWVPVTLRRREGGAWVERELTLL